MADGTRHLAICNPTARASNECCISRPACGEITAELCHPDALANSQRCCLHSCGALSRLQHAWQSTMLPLQVTPMFATAGSLAGSAVVKRSPQRNADRLRCAACQVTACCRLCHGAACTLLSMTLNIGVSRVCCRHSGQTSSTQKGSTAGTAAATATEELVHGGVAADVLAAGSAQPQGLRNSAVRIPVSIYLRPCVSGHSLRECAGGFVGIRAGRRRRTGAVQPCSLMRKS